MVQLNKHFFFTKVICMILFLLIMLNAVSCSSDKVKPISATKEEKKVVGNIGDYEIYYDELRYVAVNYRLGMEAYYGEDIWDDVRYQQKLTDTVYEALLYNYAVLTLCHEVMIEMGEDAIEEAVQASVEELVAESCNGKMSTYKEMLAENYLTDRYLRFVLEVDELVTELYYAYAEDLELFEYDDVQSFLTFALDGGVVYTQNIYLENQTAEEETQNLTKIQDIYSQLQNGAEFDDFLPQSDDYSTQYQDNGYYFTFGEMDEEYEQVVRQLQEGEYSEVLTTSSGYYIIKRLEPAQSYIISNINELFLYYQYACLNEKIANKKTELQFVPNEYGQSLSLWKLS